MCKSPTVPTQNDNDLGFGVGSSPPTSPKKRTMDLEVEDSMAEIFEELDKKLEIKAKNAELQQIQTLMLSVPRAERKKLKVSADKLDNQIKQLTRDFASSSEVQRTAAALQEALDTAEPNEITPVLQRLVKMTAELTSVDEIGLYYLIGMAESVAASMHHHGEHREFFAASLQALCNLFAGLAALDNGDTIVSQLSSAELGDAVVKGMGIHLEDAEVQLYGCRVVNVLAVNMRQVDWQAMQETDLEGCVAVACFFASGRVACSKARRQHVKNQQITQWADSAMRLL